MIIYQDKKTEVYRYQPTIKKKTIKDDLDQADLHK
jgi:hypothetical protein